MFELHNVTYRYQQVTALDGLSLTIARGERAVLLGANGSGKSTLLRILDGLYFPHMGTVTFCGQKLSQESFEDEEFAFGFRRRVGLVFQNPEAQLFSPTVFDEVAFGLLQLGWAKDQIARRVNEILQTMGLVHLKDRAPYRLSGGEKKRVALASVLALEPEVLLLDEPTGGLDPRGQSQIVDLIVGWGGGAKTVVTATQDLTIVEDIADKCHVLQSGQVVAEGRPAEILSSAPLLESTNLVHAHRHSHGPGEVHSHPHRHTRR